MQLETPAITTFQAEVWKQYAAHSRDLPWRRPDARGNFDPYAILVSEIMLQQTQVNRVIPKYEVFMKTFPDITALAGAPLGAVLTLWSGLGYNRRAKFLHQAAQHIQGRHDGSMPRTLAELIALPGVGKNTAGAIIAYAYNQPAVFIETNIRTVYIHHYFAELEAGEKVADSELLPLVTQTLDRKNPREWYWALMDYGTRLKATHGNTGRLSKSYVRQGRFEGSLRQLRGRVLRELILRPLSLAQLTDILQDERAGTAIGALLAEGIIVRLPDGRLHLPV